jgi:hypothetical protein
MAKEEKQEVQADEIVKAIRAEYENKIKEQEAKFEEALKKQKDDLSKEHIAQIHALFANTEIKANETDNKQDDDTEIEKTFYEEVEDILKKKLKI